tara:strand:+ start:56 stop:1189 length:1134 start_codon:yes stop_codon:yes gene_type:complete
MDITQLLSFCMQQGASDLHLSAGNPPVFRLYGELRRVKTEPLEAEEIQAMLFAVMSKEQREDYTAEKELDFAIAFGEHSRFRVNIFKSRNGMSAVFRVIPSKIPTLADLDMPAIFRQFCSLDRGLVLITGPSGSGKSTTLAAMIDHINSTQKKHVITIEDPVEFVHRSKKSLINHRELGSDTHSYGRALRAALREDPDVILVGELRDYETISLALTAAETGSLVFATLHANSAPKTIDRIIDVFPREEKDMVRAMLASSLQGVVSQQLLKRKGEEGRIAAFETLVATHAVRNLVREGKVYQLASVMQTGARHGMMTMEDAITDLVAHNMVDRKEAYRGLATALDLDKSSIEDMAYLNALGGEDTLGHFSGERKAYGF